MEAQNNNKFKASHETFFHVRPATLSKNMTGTFDGVMTW
jgi:hypothetical protein